MRLLLTTMVGAGLAGCVTSPWVGQQPSAPQVAYHYEPEDPVIVETFGADGVTADFALTDLPDLDTLAIEWVADGVTVVPDPADVTYDAVRNALAVAPTPAAGAIVEVGYVPLDGSP